jgi:hypothetical protein
MIPDRIGEAMSEAVEILAPTNPEKLKRVIGGTRNTSFVKKPSKTRRERIVVGWLSDLDSAKHRKELVDIVDLVVVGSEGVPLVLIEAKTVKAPSYAALEMLTRWAASFGAYLAPDEHAVRRMVKARLAEAEERLIASALIEGDKLVVWSCEPKRYAVPVSDIPALARINPKRLGDFELNESGSRLHWDEGDVDLSLDGIRYFVDPKARREQDRASREEAARYAGAIRMLREEHELAQADIPGLTERQVRRVEQGESTPRSDTLKKLAAAHGMSLDQYLKELAKRSRSRR